MKKVLYSLLTLAAALTVTSCLKEVERSADPVLGGPTVEAEFTLNLDQLLTKAYADGTKATKLSYAFFDAEGTVVASLTATKIAIPDANKINVKLSKGVAYTFVAWVESASSVYTISSDFKTVTMATTGLTANNDNYDAFYGTVAISSDDTKTTVSKEVELKRPFAQINLLVPDANTVEYTSFKSAMTVKSAYTSMNLLTGALTGDPTDITFASASATEPTIKTNHKYLAMNYVFASADAANFPVSFTVTPDDNAAEAVTVDLASVSLKRNRRTNLVGNIFKTQVDGSITITINPSVVDPAEEEVLPTLQLALPAGATSAGPSAVNLPLTVGAGPQTVGMTSPNSTGDVSFGQAANTLIANVTDNGDGTATVTPIANGTTTFVGHITAGETKAATSAVDVVFTVVVTGGAAPAQAVATPTFTPAAGEYTAAQSVEITCSTEDASIYYTTDGTDPTSASTAYTTAIAVGETMTIKAIAVKEGMENSAVATAAYTINIPQVATPTFTPAAGTYTSAQSVEIACATEGASIYYTTDGTDPTSASTAYTTAIAVGETMTIKAIAVKEGMENSAVATAAYTINIPQVATPTFTPAAGTYTSAQSVTIACETTGASIYYTTDGSAPTASSTPYTAAIAVSATTTIKAIAVKNGMKNSEIAEATYTIDAESVVYSLSPVATGTNSSPHNSYTAAATATISAIEWSVMGNSNMVPWRIGGKSITNENREIFSLDAISENVSKIEVTHGEASSITVNSVTLVVASDSSFETVVSEITKNDFAASSTMTFNRPDGKTWANCYYKFVYNVTVSGDKNKFLEFVGADFTGK